MVDIYFDVIIATNSEIKTHHKTQHHAITRDMLYRTIPSLGYNINYSIIVFIILAIKSLYYKTPIQKYYYYLSKISGFHKVIFMKNDKQYQYS